MPSCSKCQCEMRIVKAENVLRKGKLYVDHTIECVNPQCDAYQKPQIVSNEQPLNVEE